MKKITRLILFPFLRLLIIALGSTISVFVILVFIEYLSQFIGKGLGVKNYFLLTYYLSVASLPQALPLAIMLASIVSTGSLAESSEIVALKASGVSLARILRPLIVVITFVSFTAYYLNSFFVPKNSLKGFMLLYDINEKKPDLLIQEGIFCDAIPGFSMKIGEKKESFYNDIIIYDHRQKNKIPLLVTAKQANISYNKDTYSLIITLLNGHNYIDLDNKEDIEKKNPYKFFLKINFKTQKLEFELNSFKFKDGSKTRIFKKGCTRDDLKEHMIKSTNSAKLLEEIFLKTIFIDLNLIDNNIVSKQKKTLASDKAKHIKKFLANSNNSFNSYVTNTAIRNTKKVIQNLSKCNEEFNVSKKWANIYEIERYKMSTWALSCFSILLIGASLGIIIKKGGLGLPLIISAVLLVIHYVIEVITEKMAIYGKMSSLHSAMAANYVMIPLGIVLFIFAHNDARILEYDFYSIFFRKILMKFKRK